MPRHRNLRFRPGAVGLSSRCDPSFASRTRRSNSLLLTLRSRFMPAAKRRNSGVFSNCSGFISEGPELPALHRKPDAVEHEPARFSERLRASGRAPAKRRHQCRSAAATPPEAISRGQWPSPRRPSRSSRKAGFRVLGIAPARPDSGPDSRLCPSRIGARHVTVRPAPPDHQIVTARIIGEVANGVRKGRRAVAHVTSLRCFFAYVRYISAFFFWQLTSISYKSKGQSSAIS